MLGGLGLELSGGLWVLGGLLLAEAVWGLLARVTQAGMVLGGVEPLLGLLSGEGLIPLGCGEAC